MIFEFLSAIASIVGLLIIFIFVFVVCDKHLIPCIEVFIQGYNIPEEIAAVTLVAFGSACPELMLNTVGVIENTSDLSLPAVLGSAMIAFGLIPSLCLLLNDRPAYSIQFWPVIREVRVLCFDSILCRY